MRRAGRRRQAGRVDVATTSSPSCAALRPAPDRPRGHARPRRHRRVARRARSRATRLLRFLQETTKSYRGVIVFGIATSTLDAAGEVLVAATDAARRATRSSAIAALRRRHRAGAADGVRDEGRRAPPARARARGQGGRARAAGPCTSTGSTWTGFDARSVPAGHRVVECWSGTYVRTLAADLGVALGGARTWRRCGGSRVGAFTLAESRPLDDVVADPPPCVLLARRRAARYRADHGRRRARAARSHGTCRSPPARSQPRARSVRARRPTASCWRSTNRGDGAAARGRPGAHRDGAAMIERP